MMISVGMQKGGCGKSTLAYNFAHHLSSLGKTVVLADCDPQKSAKTIYDERVRSQEDVGKPGFDCVFVPTTIASKLYQDAKSLFPDTDVVIFDCPPTSDDGPGAEITAAAFMASDVIILPLRPSNIDLLVFGRTLEWVDRVKKVRPDVSVFVVITMFDSRVKDHHEFKVVIAKLLDNTPYHPAQTSIGNRVAFSRAFNDYRSVFETEPDSRGAREMVALMQEVGVIDARDYAG